MKFFPLLAAAALALGASALQRQNIDADWRFAFGHTDPAKDFGCGTEYFNYLTKASSIHNEGPYSAKFNDSTWVRVDLPFDFVVDLPYNKDASHSHGYKEVGYKYPESSVGWYRKAMKIDREPGERVYLVFDGIFRDSRVWVNGFYLGGEPSGYAQQRYDITPYLKADGSDALITVRADGTLEEGWFYEGAGIYRHAWIERAPGIHIKPNSLRVSYDEGGYVTVSGTLLNATDRTLGAETIGIDIEGTGCSATVSIPAGTPPMGETDWNITLRPENIKLWSPSEPNLYNVTATLGADTTRVRTGFRSVRFDKDRGLLVNGERVQMRGADLHQDHAGVGAGIPDAVHVYRLKTLKDFGFNTIRTSHNPVSPEMLAACDSLGFLVIEENRLLGINDYHTGQLRKMIDRDFNHPSIVLWSVGNEEWGVEWDPRGADIVAELRDLTHRMDTTRLMTVATSSGPTVVSTADVAGYNYITQNPVDKYRTEYPDRLAFGSEETTGVGTRGIYFDDRENGRMASLNREADVEVDSTLNRIGRGWKFYRDRPWLAGVCYWTGLDYRGEPNPLSFPATGSQRGVFDYAGFPKDEAFYLKSQWTDEPVLHILPHWNLKGHEGETIPVWVYTNLDEVELIVNGKNLGRKKMTPGDFLAWDAIYQPGRIEARGYRNGKRVLTERVETSGPAAQVQADVAHAQDDIMIVNITLLDSKGRFAADACPDLTIELPEGVTLLGCGNGDSAIQVPERPAAGTRPASFTFPAFNGHAQFILRGATAIPTITL